MQSSIYTQNELHTSDNYEIATIGINNRLMIENINGLDIQLGFIYPNPLEPGFVHISGPLEHVAIAIYNCTI